MIQRALFAAALTVVSFGFAQGPAEAAETPSFWKKTATAEQLNAAWPAGVTAEGRVVLECTPDPQGNLTRCRVVKESPGGVGFGAAALKLAEQYQMRPGAEMSSPNPGTTRLVIPFMRPLDVRPDWRRKPTAADLLSVWPKDAYLKGIGGRAILSCLADVTGALYDCAVASETPVGAGYGQAAMALTPQFTMKPAMRGGKPVVSLIGIPVNFDLPKGSRPQRFSTTKIVTAAMVWTKAPSHADVVAAYPKQAKADQIGGQVTLHCQFTDLGTLTHCETITETPRGQGFGTAAKALANSFQIPPQASNGDPIKGVGIQLPVTFSPEMLKAGGSKVRPSWAAIPSADVMASVYPTAAAKAGVTTARVVMACTALAEGKLDCKVESEEPAGLGFADAALKMAPYFRMNTWTIEGLPTIGVSLRLPIRFEGAAPTESAAAAAPPPAKP